MSAKSKKSSRKKTRDRAFATAVLAQARERVAHYQVIVWHEDGEWYGRGLELPHVFGDGPTPQACIDATREALTGAVALLIERGERPPTPARAGKRTTQVNVRLTAEEKALFEETARRKGFTGLSDFLRAAGLQETM